MKQCLNKRDHHETTFDEQEDLPQKLQTRNKGQFQELTDSPDARGWASLTVEVTELQQVIVEMDDRLGDIQSDLEEIVERLK